MLFRSLALISTLSLSLWAADLVPQVRAAIARGDIPGGEKLVEQSRQASGDTPEVIEAMSWLGRGSLAAGKLELAEVYARKTYELSLEQLKKRKLDDERRLPIGLGAAIEVEAQVMAQRGERADAVAYLQKELAKFGGTSIRTRIQKNINLLALTGKPAPALETKEWLGSPPVGLAALRGKPVLLFFWAHWCPDCKAEAPILSRLQQEHKNLVVIAPTQRYGYIAGGEEAPPDIEKKYIEQIRQQFYGDLRMTVPVSEENFRNYGASTSPTLVLIDRTGIVRLYHPGRMTYEELAPVVAKLAAVPKPAAASAGK